MNIDKKEALNRLKAIEEETRQLRAIIDKKDDWTSVIDVESACKWLGEDDLDVIEFRVMSKHCNIGYKTTNQKSLEVCIKAVNTENGNIWKADFDNRNTSKWYNWFEKKSSGWVVDCSVGYDYASNLGSAFYYQTEGKAKHGLKHFKQYYDIWLGN